MFLIAYFGPETVMPLLSVLAAVGGAVMMFWRNIVYFCKRVVRGVLRKSP